MIYYIKGEGENTGKFAEALFEIREWTGSDYGPDVAHDLEENIPWGSVMSWKEYQEIIDWWENDAKSEGFDMDDLEIWSNTYEELDFCFDEDDL